MKESTLFILDASPSMKSPFPAGQDNRRGVARCRLDCAKKAIETWIRDHIEPFQENDTCVLVLNSLQKSNIGALGEGLARPTPRLMNRIRYVEAASLPNNTKLGDFCQALLTATDDVLKYKEDVSEEKEGQSKVRIVLLTDAEHEVLMNMQKILVALDRLRRLQCRIEVIGFDFTKSGIYEKPLAAEMARSSIKTPQEEDEDKSGEVEEDDESVSDETPEGYFRYTLKNDREALLLSLVEKTGGRVVAASNMQQVLEAGQSIFVGQTSSRDSTDKNTVDSADIPPANGADNSWACERCTLINSSTATCCDACGTVREGGQPSLAASVAGIQQQMLSGLSFQALVPPREKKRKTSHKRSIRDRIGFDMRIHWDGSEPLEEWLEAVKPSEISTSADGCEWIQVENIVAGSPGFGNGGTCMARKEEFQPALDKVKAIIERKNRVTKAEKQDCIDSLIETAKKQHVISGKWLVFASSPEKADSVWNKVARASVEGQLGCGAKIGPAKDGGRVVCCVYVKDFTDKSEVKRVLHALKDLGLFVSGFKPDFFTDLEIYTNNEWRLSPTIYSAKEVLEW